MYLISLCLYFVLDAVDEKLREGIEIPVYTDSALEEMIDQILKENDLNGDGYVDYAEFKAVQEKTWGKS